MTVARLVLLVVMFGAVTSAKAANKYYCRCDTGRQEGCVAGSDAADGNTPAQAKSSLPDSNEVSAAPAGTAYLLCQGGAWSDFAGWLGVVNPNATRAQPITWSSYAAGWGGNQVRPWVRIAAGGMAFNFGYVSDTLNDGGYVIRGLRLDGVSCANHAPVGVFSGGKGLHDLTVEDSIIENFGQGFELAGGSAPNQFVTIRNNIIRRSWYVAGILGEADDLLIEGNTFERNGGNDACSQGNGLSHHIYLGGEGHRGVVRNNTFTKAGNGATGGDTCTSGGITAHGGWQDLVIEANVIDNGNDIASACGGIDPNPGYTDSTFPSGEHFRGLVIRGNVVVGGAIAITSAPRAIVENNRIVIPSGVGLGGCFYLPRSPRDGISDDFDSAPTIRNNTCYLFAPVPAFSLAMRLNFASGHGDRAVFTNNLVMLESGGANKQCFEYGARSQYDFVRNNLCAGADTWATTTAGATYSTLVEAQGAGFDSQSVSGTASFTAPPLSANGYGLQLQPTSLAKNAGDNATCARLDATGRVRADGHCDIGAREEGLAP